MALGYEETAAVEKMPEAPLPRCLANLEDALDRLAKRIEQLDSKLQPISLPHGDAEVRGPHPEEVASLLIAELRKVERRLRDAERRLGELHDAVEV
jgi:hypothetical protein